MFNHCWNLEGLVGLFEGEEAFVPPLLSGDDSLASFPAIVFCTAIFSENFFKGSFLSIFSSSTGVYWSKNSSIDKYPPPTRTIDTLNRIWITVDFVFVHSHSYFLSSKGVHSFTFSHEHNLKFLSLRVVVDEFSYLLVYRVVLHRNVNWYFVFEFHNVVL